MKTVAQPTINVEARAHSDRSRGSAGWPLIAPSLPRARRRAGAENNRADAMARESEAAEKFHSSETRGRDDPDVRRRSSDFRAESAGGEDFSVGGGAEVVD